MATAIKEVEIVDLDRTDAFKRFDQACRQYLNVTASEFIRKYKRGGYDDVDVDSIPGLANIFTILPFAGL